MRHMAATSFPRPWQNLIAPQRGKRQSLLTKAKVLLAKVNRRDFNKLLSAVIVGPKKSLVSSLKPDAKTTREDGKQLLWHLHQDLSYVIDYQIAYLKLPGAMNFLRPFSDKNLEEEYTKLYLLMNKVANSPDLKQELENGDLDETFAIFEMVSELPKHSYSFSTAYAEQLADSSNRYMRLEGQNLLQIQKLAKDVMANLKKIIVSGRNPLPSPEVFFANFVAQRSAFNLGKEQIRADYEKRVAEIQKQKRLAMEEAEEQRKKLETNYFYTNNEAWFYAAKNLKPESEPWLEGKIREYHA